MRIDVVTLFPEMVAQAARVGVTGRARERGLWRLRLWNPRDFATDNHRRSTTGPYGGGPGMVMLAAPLAQAIAAAKVGAAGGRRGGAARDPPDAGGRPLTHARVLELARRRTRVRAARRAVRRHRRAPGRARGRRGDRDRRFRGVGRRAAGADADRRDRAAVAGRAERRAVGARGFVRRRAARLPALHAAGGVRRRGGARRAVVGASCGDSALAPASSRWGARGSGGPTCWRTGR